MPSNETTLTRIHQEIQDVMNRERELKKLKGINYIEDDNNNEDDEPSEEQKSTFTRIQEEIQNVLDRERELKKLHNNTRTNGFSIGSDNNDDSAVEDMNDRSSTHSGFSSHTSKSDEIVETIDPVKEEPVVKPAAPIPTVRSAFFRAKSTSALEDHSDPSVKPNFRRLMSANPQKGVMHRFLKSRGKLQVVTAMTTPQVLVQPKSPFSNMPSTNGFSKHTAYDSYELAPPKPPQGQQFIRRNFIPTDKKIQQDIEATYKREAELKTLRQSQGNLAVLNDAELDAPLGNYGLRASKSMAQLYNSTEDLSDPPVDSAPSSLKPAKSLAQLCDAKDEEVTSPQALITHFQQMIRKNQVAQRP